MTTVAECAEAWPHSGDSMSIEAGNHLGWNGRVIAITDGSLSSMLSELRRAVGGIGNVSGVQRILNEYLGRSW